MGLIPLNGIDAFNKHWWPRIRRQEMVILRNSGAFGAFRKSKIYLLLHSVNLFNGLILKMQKILINISFFILRIKSYWTS